MAFSVVGDMKMAAEWLTGVLKSSFTICAQPGDMEKAEILIS